MTETDKTPPPLPPAGGSYALVNGVLVRVPEDDQQVHATDGGTTATKAASKTRTKE